MNIEDDKIYTPNDFQKILKDMKLPYTRMIFIYKYEPRGITKSYRMSSGRRYYTGKLIKENIERIEKHVRNNH